MPKRDCGHVVGYVQWYYDIRRHGFLQEKQKFEWSKKEPGF